MLRQEAGEGLGSYHLGKGAILERQKKKISGSCLCGSSRFSIFGEFQDLYFCHCSQCRKNYGLYGAFAGILRADFALDRSEDVRSFQSSKNVKRSFCGTCGSPLTWDREGDERIYVLMGSLDGDVRTTGAKHIYLDDKGGYYEICD